MENKNLNMGKEPNSKTTKKLTKQEIEIEMKKIREIMEKRQREANTAELKRQKEEQEAKIKALKGKLKVSNAKESLKSQEEQERAEAEVLRQKQAEIEALRQKLQRERQAQIIRDIADRNAAEYKAYVMAEQIAKREEQKAREAGKTSDFDAEQKKREMMDAFNIQRSKANSRNLIPDEVNLKLAEDNLQEIESAQNRRKEVEKTMEELRAEQIKRLEEEKKQKTNAIKNIFNKLTSLPRRKIPTQEELSNDGLREGLTTVNSVKNNKGIQEERVEQNLEMSKNIPYMDKKEEIQSQKTCEKLSTQDEKLKKLYDVAVELKKMTRKEADESFKKGRQQERINRQAEEVKKEAEIAKEKERQKLFPKMSYATQQYFSKLFNSGSKLSRKDNERNINKRTKSNMLRDLKCEVNEQLAFENYVQKAQDNKNKKSREHIGLGRIA